MKHDLNRFFDVSVDLLSIAGTDGFFKRVNPAWQRALGWSQAELLAKPFLEFVHPEDLASTQSEVGRLKGGAVTLTFDNRYRSKDGGYRWLRWTSYPENGLLYSVARDITSFKEEEDRFRLVLESSPIAVVCTSAGGNICLLNRAMETLTGYQRAELLGQPIEILVPKQQREKHQGLRTEYENEPEQRPMGQGRDLVVCRKDGTQFPAEIGLNPLIGPDGALVLAAIVDLTGRKEAEERIKIQAVELERVNARLAELVAEDALTGLKNRRYFFEHLERYLKAGSRRGTPLSIVMLDVDNFKTFNDTFGHQAGDEVLRRVASILREAARTTDTVARYGGEEFVIALPETDMTGAIRAAERFRRGIEQSPWPQREITASLGTATAAADSIDCDHVGRCAQTLLEDADRALYYSKENGRNRATHVDEID